MSKEEYPITPAKRFLKGHNADLIPFLHKYEEKGGTKLTSKELNVPEHSVIKTLVLEDDKGKAIMALMHGDNEVSTKELARVMGCKSIKPCDQQKALKVTGYKFGGTSPFGTKTNIDVYMESSIMESDSIYINGGKQGFIICIKPQVVVNLLNPQLVSVAVTK